MNSLRRMKPALGTFVQIATEGPDTPDLMAATERAFAEILRVHALMSFHEPASDVSRLNREATSRPVRVDRRTVAVLEQALALSRDSGGVFDITVAPALVAWNLLPRHDWDALRGRTGAGRWQDIELTGADRVRFRRPLRIDLGGIAKGYAVDCAVASLAAAGVPSGLVNAGGDLRVFGPCSRLIQLRDPADPQRLVPLGSVMNEALATSAPYFCRALHAGRRVSHLVDPRTGAAKVAPVSVSVRAPRCIDADALTKVVLMAPREAVVPLLLRGARAYRLSGSPRALTAAA